MLGAIGLKTIVCQNYLIGDLSFCVAKIGLRFLTLLLRNNGIDITLIYGY